MVKNQWKLRFLPGKPLKMDEILKNVISYGPHMPGIDLNPVRENVEQFLKTDLVQPTPNITLFPVWKLVEKWISFLGENW